MDIVLVTTVQWCLYFENDVVRWRRVRQPTATKADDDPGLDNH